MKETKTDLVIAYIVLHQEFVILASYYKYVEFFKNVLGAQGNTEFTSSVLFLMFLGKRYGLPNQKLKVEWIERGINGAGFPKCESADQQLIQIP
jgi:hypothetical protein